MTTYAHTTFETAKSLLAARLNDSGMRFHSEPELGFSLVEALRVWNAVTGQHREQGQAALEPGVWMYQLAEDLFNGTELLRAQTITDRDMVSEIEYHLMEPQGLESWAGGDQYTFDQVLSTVQRRRDQFLADTACVVSSRTDVVTGGSNGIVSMGDNVVGIRRAVFATASGRYSTLRKSDERFALSPASSWRTHGISSAYSVLLLPSLSAQLIPPPAVNGTVESVVVTTGAELDTVGVGTLLGIPDDLAWGVKYGALADLFRDQNSTDQGMSEYCENMYKLAVQLGTIMPVVLSAQLDGVYVNPAAISHTDMRQDGWQGTKRGSPTVLSIVAPDCVGVTPVPDSRPHIATLDVIRTAIVPGNDTDYLQIPREHLDAVLGMAQRTCMLKIGGHEYAATDTLAAKFFDQAQHYALRRSAAATALQTVRRGSDLEPSVNQWEHTPRTVEDRADEVKSERNARRRPFRK